MLLYLAAILKPWNSKQVVFAAAQAVGVYAAAVLHRTKATVAQFVLHLDVLSILGGGVLQETTGLRLVISKCNKST